MATIHCTSGFLYRVAVQSPLPAPASVSVSAQQHFLVIVNVAAFRSRSHTLKKPTLISFHSPKLTSNALRTIESNSVFEAPLLNRRADFGCKQLLIRYSTMLQDCASRNALDSGRAIHAHLMKGGADPDSHLWNCLVNMYAKCGRNGYAKRVFELMPNRDVVSWTALISGFVAEENGREGVRLFCEMWREAVWPNGFVFATGLKACSICLDLGFGQQVHGGATKLGFLSDLFVGSALVDLYAKCGEIKLAEKVFSNIPEHNTVSWNALLNGYIRFGDEEEVLDLFHRMMETETRVSKFTLSSVLKACAGLGNVREGQAVHSLLIKTRAEIDEFIQSSLVDMYSKCGLAEDAYKVFVGVEAPDVVTWSAMLSCFDQQGCSYEASELFIKMQRRGIKPNQFTLSSLLSVASDLGVQKYGDSIHAYVTKVGFDTDNVVGNALVTMYMNFGATQDGCKIFDVMTDRDLVSWNALLSGFHNGSSCIQGLKIFAHLLAEGFKPNKYTFISVLRSCASISAADYGCQVHAHIIKNDLKDDSFVGTALVDMYAKSGFLENASLAFNGLDEQDVFAWTVIISGYAHTDQGEKSVECFCQMQREGINANEFTFASVLRACSSIASLENGLQLHSWVIKSGHSGDGFVGSALIDMYGKCGCIQDAVAVFDGSPERDVVSWNAIIFGYSRHGYGEKALKAFQSMLDEGIKPDGVTFIGVLSACSHVGLVEEGQEYFNSLGSVYGMTPTIEHYACMVDILGRAGKLNEVENLLEEMTIVPNALIWQTVLGACKMHQNVELGEKAAEKLFELEPLMHSTYVLLSNIYAGAGRWADDARVRSLMSSRGVKKEPACSWIVVGAQVHLFLPQDGSHPKTKEIHLKLEELQEQLILAGYIPNTDYELHNVTEDEKKGSLLYHCERLALAYGLISIESPRPIRIYKNLRMCGDCHSAIKLISDITNRDIIIRDISRFHHFENGSCSCRDYWVMAFGAYEQWDKGGTHPYTAIWMLLSYLFLKGEHLQTLADIYLAKWPQPHTILPPDRMRKIVVLLAEDEKSGLGGFSGFPQTFPLFFLPSHSLSLEKPKPYCCHFSYLLPSLSISK
ncbi:hypothetical protein ACLOJK_007939 [Asimina triloba]